MSDIFDDLCDFLEDRGVQLVWMILALIACALDMVSAMAFCLVMMVLEWAEHMEIHTSSSLDELVDWEMLQQLEKEIDRDSEDKDEDDESEADES